MFVEKILEWKYEEQIKKQSLRGENEIWVSELVQCKQKAEYNKKFPFIFTIEPRLILGEIVHEGLEAILMNEFGYDIEVEVYKQLENYTLSGRIDALNNEEVVEIKYAADVKDSRPYEHHVLQLRIYMWLADRERGRLIYITPNKILEFTIENRARTDEILMLIDNWQSPRYEWECKYCQFVRICPKARNGGR